jgi:hypothetical protein
MQSSSLRIFLHDYMGHPPQVHVSREHLTVRDGGGTLGLTRSRCPDSCHNAHPRGCKRPHAGVIRSDATDGGGLRFVEPYR